MCNFVFLGGTFSINLPVAFKGFNEGIIGFKDVIGAIALSKKERGEIVDEVSTSGGMAAGDPGDVEGVPGQKKKKKKPSLIREEDPTVDEVLNYLLQRAFSMSCPVYSNKPTHKQDLFYGHWPKKR